MWQRKRLTVVPIHRPIIWIDFLPVYNETRYYLYFIQYNYIYLYTIYIYLAEFYFVYTKFLAFFFLIFVRIIL